MEGHRMMAAYAAAVAAPEAEDSDTSPLAGGWYSHGPPSDFMSELSSIHAANATCAALQADVAAKQAQQLAQWAQYLFGQITTLQQKVVELEDWKKKALVDMNKLRFEHKLLRKKVSPEADDETLLLPNKANSLPLLLADHVEAGLDPKGKQRGKAASAASTPSSMRPPPGLEDVGAAAAPESPVGSLEKSKSVRFAAAEAADQASSQPARPTAASSAEAQDVSSRMLRSLSALSEASHITDTPDEGFLEGVSVVPLMVDGMEAEVATWRIGNLSTKLRSCMGRALVSPPFSMWGLQDLRLMVFPDGQDVAKGPRSRRQKELYAKKVSEGPLEGCLKLKAPECPAPHTLLYYLKIGTCRRGPFEHNFAECTVNGCSNFGMDWLKQVEADQSLIVTLELLKRGAVANAAHATSC